MLSFRTWTWLRSTLREEADPKVIKHLTHLEDLVLTDYVDGATQAVTMLDSLRQMFAGHASSPVNVSVKMDGAPAIVVGNDPADGQFFVGTKGAFAKTPRIAKSLTDIDRLYAGKQGLIDTMRLAFTSLRPLWSASAPIVQGDVLFTPDIKRTTTIDGMPYLTFKPNTIVYGVPAESDFGAEVRAASFGVCFHTTYTGSALGTLSASSGANLSMIRPTPKVLFVSPRYRDISGSLTFTASETQTLTNLVADIRRKTSNLSSNKFLALLKTTPLLQSEFMIFQNALVREGQPITLSPGMFVSRFVGHLTQRGEKAAADKRSPAGQASTRDKYAQLATLVTNEQDGLVAILAWQQAVVSAKTLIIQKLNTTGQMETFYDTEDGLTSGQHEGFVAADHHGNFVKLVDRSQFSRLNLTGGRFNAD